MTKLLMIPSGYKTTKLYSVIPTDGTGDFAVTSGAGTRINSQGLIESTVANQPRLTYVNGCPKLLVEPSVTNLLLRSEEFDNASWINDGTVTVTANDYISPNGTLTAEKFNVTTGSGGKRQSPTTGLINSRTFTFSIYARSDEGGQFALRIHRASNPSDNKEVIFNLTSSWQRFSITHTFSSTGADTSVYSAIRTAQIGNTLNRTTYFWGAQLEEGSTPYYYIPTTSVSVTRNADVITVTPPTGTTSIITTSDGVDTTIPYVSGSWQVPNGLYEKIRMI